MNLAQLKSHWIHLAAIAAFFLTCCVFFYPQLQGKVLPQGDIRQWQGMAKEVQDFKEKTGESSLWTNSMFSGMPTYYISAPSNSNLNIYVKRLLGLGFTGQFGMFLLGMISFYILMMVLRIKPVLAILGSIAFALTTNNLVLLEAGHNTKIWTLMSSPLVIAGVISAYRHKYLMGLILFGIGMSVNLLSDHPQMTYYLGIVLFVYVIAEFIKALKANKLKSFFYASGVLVVGLLLAIGSFSSKLLPTLEYSEDTMRGKPILTKTNDKMDSSSKVEGLAWDYAMKWSNGWVDLLPSFIPRAVGGSSGERVGSDSAFAKELKKRGQSVRDLRAPTYWGGLPFTSGPIYFGAVIFLLFFIGAFAVKGPIKWWIVIGSFLTFLISLGYNLEWFNRLLFDYLPAFNKFRTPNSVLSVTAIIIPILAILTLQKILSEESLNEKLVLGSGLALTSLCFALAIVGPSVFDMTAESDLQYAQYGFDTSIFEEDRASMLRSSALRTGLIMLFVMGFIWAVMKSKISNTVAMIGIAIFALADQMMVNLRYMSPSDYETARRYKNNFEQRPVDKQILQDPDPYYRVYDRSINTFNSTQASYYHKCIGGYHAAKLQRYQDMIEYHIAPGNEDVLNMLNTKYIIFRQDQSSPEQVQMNPAALGNAWFVNNVKMVDTADEEIEALNDFDPLGTAVVHKDFSNYVNGFNGPKEGTIKLTSYAPNELVYQSNSNSEQLAVFSEVWYGPNKGWNAYIDGQKADHIRANYILRALKIPSGNHEIRFKFEPSSFKTGSILSLVSSGILLLLFGFYLFRVFKYGWEGAEFKFGA